MHAVEALAERLVLAYEDEENLTDWVPFTDRATRRHALVQAVRRVLEREMAQTRPQAASQRFEYPGAQELLLDED